MSNRNPAFFRRYLTALGSFISYAATARKVGVSESWVYKVDEASRAAAIESPGGPSVFLFEEDEGDGNPLWFHQHVENCVRRSIEETESYLRARVTKPRLEPTLFQGQKVPARDPLLVGRPDLIELLGLPDDLLRDASGAVVWEMHEVHASSELVLAVLAAHVRKLYGKRLDMTSEVTMKGGVLVSNGSQLPKPTLEVIEQQVQDADFSDVAEAMVPVTDTEPNEPPIAPDYADEPDRSAAPEPDTGPMIKEAAPTEYSAQPNPLIAPRSKGRPLTALERDLLSRLPKSTERPA